MYRYPVWTVDLTFFCIGKYPDPCVHHTCARARARAVSPPATTAGVGGAAGMRGGVRTHSLLATAAVLLSTSRAGDAAFVPLDPDQHAGPYYLLQPEAFATPLGDDLGWASENIPLFESANSTLDLVYYYRWRTYKSHIHSTGRVDNISHVVTEFSPNVSWAGKYNTINCAAGHHMLEGGWLRQSRYIDSYTRWWVSKEAKHNYYYWFATALARNFALSGDVTLLQEVVPLYREQFLLYARAQLPGTSVGRTGGGASFSPEHDCLWNSPGNEGQEESISGSGCRTLVQSVMFGEASSLSFLLAAIGDSTGAQEMQAEAERWQRRVLRLWNENITAFDTLRMPHPNMPPPPPPAPCNTFKTKDNCATPRCEWNSTGSCVRTPFPPPGWVILSGHNGTYCEPRQPLWQGDATPAACLERCTVDAACKFATIEWFPPSRPGGGYCKLSVNCSKQCAWDNATCTCTLPPPDCVPQKPGIATFAKPEQQQQQQQRTVWNRRTGQYELVAGSTAVAAESSSVALAGVRELASLSSPWYFRAVPKHNASAYASSWNTAFDPDGLAGDYGLRTAERRHPKYFCDKPRPGPGGGCCSWSGPMWPFESAKTISAAITVLNEYTEEVTTLDKTKLWKMVWQYAAIHTSLWKITNCTDGTYLDIEKNCPAGGMGSLPACCYGGHLPLPPGCKHAQPGWPSCPAPLAYTGCDMCKQIPNGGPRFWIAENGCADGGDPASGLSGPSWVDGATEGYEYNHSTFIDLIMTGLVGLSVSALGNRQLTVNPLILPEDVPWWTADGILIQGKIVSVRFDLDGGHYGEGKGLKVFVGGKMAKSSPTMAKLTIQL